MRSGFRAAVVLIALAAQTLAPLAAYASVAAGPGFDDFCSADRSAKSPPGDAPALPRQNSPGHLSAHCLSCCGSAPAAVLPGATMPQLPAGSDATAMPRVTQFSIAATSLLLPPTRGPPKAS